MCAIRSRDVNQTDIMRLESAINTLWGELNTASVAHTVRMEMETTLAKCEKEFKAVLNGQQDFRKLEKDLNDFSFDLAEKSLEHAENDVPKGDLGQKMRLAIQQLQGQLQSGKITPMRARHEIKTIMRQKS